MSRSIAIPPQSAKLQFSQGEMSHLWDDENVSDDSCQRIADGGVRNFAECPVDVLASLNRWSPDNVTTSIEFWGLSECMESLGVKEAKPLRTPVLGEDGEPKLDVETGEPVYTVTQPPYKFAVKRGKETTRYVTELNGTNRPLNEDNANLLENRTLEGRTVLNGEPLIFDSLGMAVSAQHRVIGAIRAFNKNPNLPKIPFLVVRNVPAIFADTADTGRTRTGGDALARIPDVMDVDTLVDRDGKSFGPDVEKRRKQLTTELSSVIRLVNMRFCGKNVNTSIKPPAHGWYVYNLFTNIDALVNRVYNANLSVGEGKDSVSIKKVLGRNNLSAAIILSEVSDMEPIAEQSGQSLTVPPTDEPIIELDVDGWENRLKEFESQIQSGEGELYDALMKVRDANKGRKQRPQDKFASVCKIVSMMGGVPLLNFKPASEGSVIPRADSVDTKLYPIFGGADQGYWTRPKNDE